MWRAKTDSNHLSWKFILTDKEKLEYRKINPIPKKKMLPPPAPEDKNKICLALDLDETLVHGSYVEPVKFDFDFDLQIQTKKLHVYVQERPYLSEFLTAVSKNFEVVAYTASLQIYADKVIDKIDPNGYIKYRLYREHCGKYKEQYIKDLDFLGRPLERTLVVDNNPVCYIAHRDNGIPIYSYFGQPDDEGLKDLLEFLEDIKNEENVVPKSMDYSALWRKKLQESLDAKDRGL